MSPLHSPQAHCFPASLQESSQSLRAAFCPGYSRVWGGAEQMSSLGSERKNEEYVDNAVQPVPKGKHTPTLTKILRVRAQSCPTLGNHMDCSPPGSSVRAIFFRQEYWNRLLFPTPGDHPSQEPNLRLWCLLHWQVDSFPLCPLGSPYKKLGTF